MHKRLIFSFFFSFCLWASLASAASDFDEDNAEKAWQIAETQLEIPLPSYPKAENLQSFFVSAQTDNQFMVDRESITIGVDGVVRYTLVVTSPSGAQNVSYEGMRCSSAERRLYAFGHPDKTWSKARSTQWVKISNSALNRQHAALYFEYFCPNGLIVGKVDEARLALRSGGQSSIKSR